MSEVLQFPPDVPDGRHGVLISAIKETPYNSAGVLAKLLAEEPDASTMFALLGYFSKSAIEVEWRRLTKCTGLTHKKDVLEEWTSQHDKVLGEFFPGGRADPKAPRTTAQAFMVQRPALRFHLGQFVEFVGKLGHYVVHDRDDVIKQLEDFLLQHGHDPREAVKNDVLAAFARLVRIPNEVMNAWIDPREGKFLPVANGVLDLDTLELHPPSPNFVAYCTSGYLWEPDAKCPRFMQYLHEIYAHVDPAMVREAIDQAQLLFAAGLVPSLAQGIIWLLMGKSRSGKGTMIRILQALVGGLKTTENPGGAFETDLQTVAAEPLQTAADAIGARLITISEVTGGGRNRSIQGAQDLIQRISGGDAVRARRPYGQPMTVNFDATIVIAANGSLWIGDQAAAMANRLRFIAHNNTFAGREDWSLGAALRAELPGILVWALEGVRRLRELKGIVPHTRQGQDKAAAQMERSDPVRAFITENYVLDPLGCMSARFLYEKFRYSMDQEEHRKEMFDRSKFDEAMQAIDGVKLIKQKRMECSPGDPNGFSGQYCKAQTAGGNPIFAVFTGIRAKTAAEREAELAEADAGVHVGGDTPAASGDTPAAKRDLLG